MKYLKLEPTHYITPEPIDKLNQPKMGEKEKGIWFGATRILSALFFLGTMTDKHFLILWLIAGFMLWLVIICCLIFNMKTNH